MDSLVKYYFYGHDEAGFFKNITYRLSIETRDSSFNKLAPMQKLETRNPEDQSKYVIILPILNHSSPRWQIDSNPILDLPEFCIKDVNASKAVLIFDYSNESGSYDFVELIESSLFKSGVSNFSNVVFLGQNRLLKKMSFKVKVFAFDYFILSSYLHLNKILDEEYFQKLDISFMHKIKDVLCLNATPRQHRLLACAMLTQQGIFGNSIVSFPGISYGKGNTTDWNEIFDKWEMSDWAYLVKSAKSVLSAAPFKVDSFNEIGNDLVNKVDLNHYLNSAISLVNETGTDAEHQRITEKTFKALGLGHPFIIWGHPKSLEVIKDFGFNTYDSVIDTGYDSIMVDSIRFKVLTISLKKYLREKENKKKLAEILEISRFNRFWLQNGFLKAYRSKFIDPITMYIDQCLK